uniref:Histone deacetylase complex subunit SAP30 Sin3 binding domain-containing protein n=1 Tax=Oryza punctata TaxID=4537 RepID=A0A0E0KMP7_ORYPU
MMMETELCSSRVLSPPRYESGDEELSVLPRHTKVIVTGNNRTKSVLVGLQGVVKKAVGLGGWHWLVLKNGVEVKLQRNALSVLEPPTGNEDDDDIDGNNSEHRVPQTNKAKSSAYKALRVNLTKLGTPTLWRYWKHFNLVILGFIQAAKRLKTLYRS